jgi:aspartyl-tRNA(Asn)/glutamyl-tRNA(Gln) amidotransferase subunit B
MRVTTDWEPVIGLEIHAQLRTASKMFCGCSTAYGAEPNHQTCPVCMGLPGSLPAVNGTAIELAVRLGLAVGATVHSTSVFARKNYFYPDLPKGYQISQHDLPLCTGGGVWVDTEARGRRLIQLERIHLEEDAGKSSHSRGGSLVDLNRAGMPLVEVVSRPDMRSAEEAVAYMKAVHALVRWLGVSDGNMQEGSLRCDANVSVRRRGEKLGTRAELKNINSFRYVGQAVRFEIKRQIEILEAGGELTPETRTWDASAGRSLFLRRKEQSDDYRYFPEPDLPPLVLGAELIDAIASALPELPAARAARYQEELGLPAYDAGVLTADRDLADWFEAGIEALPASGERTANVKALSNWTMGEVLRRLKEDGLDPADCPLAVGRLAQLIDLVNRKVISHSIAKQVFDELWTSDAEPEAIVDARGWRQVSDADAIGDAVRAVLADHPDELGRYLSGRKKLFGFFMGRAMGRMKGKADPKMVQERLRAALTDAEANE